MPECKSCLSGFAGRQRAGHAPPLTTVSAGLDSHSPPGRV